MKRLTFPLEITKSGTRLFAKANVGGEELSLIGYPGPGAERKLREALATETGRYVARGKALENGVTLARVRSDGHVWGEAGDAIFAVCVGREVSLTLDGSPTTLLTVRPGELKALLSGYGQIVWIRDM